MDTFFIIGTNLFQFKRLLRHELFLDWEEKDNAQVERPYTNEKKTNQFVDINNVFVILTFSLIPSLSFIWIKFI